MAPPAYAWWFDLRCCPARRSWSQLPRHSTTGIRNREPNVTAQTLQPVVLCFGTPQGRDVGVCVLPKSQKILVGSFRPGLISRQSEHSTPLQVRQHTDGIQPDNPAMIENLLKFCRRFRIPVRGSESLAAHISRVQTAKIELREVEAIHRQLKATSDFQPLHTVRRLAPTQCG